MGHREESYSSEDRAGDRPASLQVVAVKFKVGLDCPGEGGGGI